MAFPTGWTHKFTITIDRTKVTGTPTGFVLLVTKDMLPSTVIDAGSTSAQDGGGDIRFTTDSAGTTRLPVEVVDFYPHATSGSRRCKIFVGMNGNEPTTGADKVIYGWCKGPTIMQQPAPSLPYGAHAVWSPSDYRGVHHLRSSFAPEATGLWLMRPRSIEYNGKTYITWLDYLSGGNGNIKIAAYTHSTGVWTPAVTISAGSVKEGHCTPTICVDNDGYLYVTWCGYSGAQYTVRKSTNVEDISTWNAAVVIASGDGVERTYPVMFCLSDDTLVLFARENGSWLRRRSTDAGATWSAGESVIGAPGSERVYCEFILGASDRVHVAWHCTSSSATVNGTHIYYSYSDNCGSATSTWSSISGASMSLPISGNGPSTRATGRVYDSSSFSTCYLAGIAVNGSNAPMISAGLFDTGTPANNRISTFTDNGSAWTKVDVVQSSTAGQQDGDDHAEGGVRFISGTTWRALMVMTVSSISEVQEWESTDSGATWSKINDITASSATFSRMPTYTRNSTGPLAVSLFNCDKTNGDYNAVHDMWFAGTHTDGVAYMPMDIIAASGFTRDSTKYRNDQTGSSGSPTSATSPFNMGGNSTCMQFNGSNYFELGTPASLLTGCDDALTVQAWTQYSNSGSTAKVSHRGPSANATCQFISYRFTDNKQYFNCGNGTTNKQAGPTAASYTSGTSFRWAGYYDGTTVSLRTAKTTVSAAGSLTGPLYTSGTDKFRIGESINGYIEEWRIAPTALSTDLLDTEYDNQDSPSTFATGADIISTTGPLIGGRLVGGGALMGGRIVR